MLTVPYPLGSRLSARGSERRDREGVGETESWRTASWIASPSRSTLTEQSLPKSKSRWPSWIRSRSGNATAVSERQERLSTLAKSVWRLPKAHQVERPLDSEGVTVGPEVD